MYNIVERKCILGSRNTYTQCYLTHYWLVFARQPIKGSHLFSLALIDCTTFGNKTVDISVHGRLFPLCMLIHSKVYLVYWTISSSIKITVKTFCQTLYLILVPRVVSISFVSSLQYHTLGWAAGQENPAIWCNVPFRRIWSDWVHQCKFGQFVRNIIFTFCDQQIMLTLFSLWTFTLCSDDSSERLCLYCYGSQTRRLYGLKKTQ